MSDPASIRPEPALRPDRLARLLDDGPRVRMLGPIAAWRDLREGLTRRIGRDREGRSAAFAEDDPLYDRWIDG